MALKIPIGVSDFKRLIEDNYYYIDKTHFISEILRQSPNVLLIPRPRRFGKTLNLSMLRYFFEPGHTALFEGLQVAYDQETMKHQGVYPVLYLTFKDAKQDSFEAMIHHFKTIIGEALRYLALDTSQLSDHDRQLWRRLSHGDVDMNDLGSALMFVTRILSQIHNKSVILLIDEYDSPIHASYQYDYYEKAANFMREFLSGALKDNSHLERGILTGILRVTKSSIFSGLNNLGVYSLLDVDFSTAFGITETELHRVLRDADCAELLPNLYTWYNGYTFGQMTIFNPWSVLQFIARLPNHPKPYWIDSSGNELVRDLITSRNALSERKLESLLAGDTVKVQIEENINFRDIANSERTLLNLLLFSGYLKPEGGPEYHGLQQTYSLKIPNFEIQAFFENSVHFWLTTSMPNVPMEIMATKLLDGELGTFTTYLQALTYSVLSFHDTAGDEPERVFHAFFLGLFVNIPDYEIRSNRESGLGRYDVLLKPKDSSKRGFIFEFKKVGEHETPETAAKNALDQIANRDYAAELRQSGVAEHIAIGVGIQGKTIAVLSQAYPSD